ncbi:xanthine dehydrogenase-like [Uranotaenia lowii]|uniref:xanthine dehydrogenase-like n=1 Tax=Uranotaenia lowii TaxID=190385 RepID=UPI00247AA886|nr:xanthine dehydrogenase-like [Uranotaenia lowii]
MSIEFSINGKLFQIDPKKVPVETSLNTFIRDHAQLKGTKFMCREGGCGACVVNVTQLNPVTKEIVTKSANSCLLPVYSCHGCDILTVEGIGNGAVGFHPIQKRLVGFNGSQCGFCTPGMVMSMYSLLESNNQSVTMRDVENNFDGNICRCTGYRPILDAFKTFATDAKEVDKLLCNDIEDLYSDRLPKARNGVCSNRSKSIQVEANELVTISREGKDWYKVYSIDQIFKCFSLIGSRPYMLVAGNTAHGVYRRRNDLQVFIDVSTVQELHQRQIGTELVVGANVTLNELLTIMNEATLGNIKFQYLKTMIKHVRLVANPSVRNFGTIAGNLMIKHEHPEFPSDIFLLLETIGASLTVLTSKETSLTVSPKEFLSINMSKKVIKHITFPPIHPVHGIFRSYKIMPVAQNARAYVNAAFLIKLSITGEIPESVTLCFGGINPCFVHATQTENYLINRPIFTNQTLKQSMAILSSELSPDHVLPDASPEYRKNLALSLYYKFLLELGKQRKILDPRYVSGATDLERPLSSGRQSYDTYPKKWPLTQNISKIEGLIQASGDAEYINDKTKLPNELYAAFVLATEVRSRIKCIDATEALSRCGVVAFYSAKNIPGINNVMPIDMGTPEVEEIFCSGEVAFHGQPVGIIVAESFELANEVTALVKVCYERISSEPIYTTAQKVIEADAVNRVMNTGYDRHGTNYDAAAEGPIKIKGHLDLLGQYHYSLETQTCFAIPVEDGLDIFSAMQHVDLGLAALSQALNMPQNSINLVVPRLGGAYGSKVSRSIPTACACVMAALLTRRPVRMVLPMETNMSSTGKRLGCFSEYEIDVDKEGRIIKLSNTYTHNAGAVVNEVPGFITSDIFKSCYKTDSWNLVGNVTQTDIAPNTFCRSPGASEAIAMVENIMEHIAHAVGKDPLEVRLRNTSKNNKMHRLIPQFRQEVNFDERKREIDMFNSKNRWRKRGIACIIMQYSMEYSGMMNALVSIYHTDGTVAITHSGVEMGQGINTKAVQVAAHILGLPTDMISVKPTSSLTSPNCQATVHSRSSEIVAFAVQKCCEMLVERLRPFRKNQPQATWQEIVNQAFLANVDFTAVYNTAPFDLRGYPLWGLTCAEVEVDILTGNVQVSRVDILEDVGESMSPGIDIGQLEGAFVMGLGYYLTEALVYDPSNGKLVNNRSWNYKVPGVKDIPIDFRIKFLQKSSNPAGVLSSKASGELALNMSPVLTYALRYALRSARKDAGLPDDWIPIGSATTPEKIFLMAGNSFENYDYN